jgi:DNA-binding transcriptional MerR regulator
MNRAEIAEQIQATWNARELARLMGVPPTTLIAWLKSGVVTPERAAGGRGRHGHKIGLSGLVELVTVVQLRAVGFSMQKIKAAVKELKEMTGEGRPLSGKLTLVFADGELGWRPTGMAEDMAVSAMRSRQVFMLFPIEQLTTDLLAKMGYEWLPVEETEERELVLAGR